ncbi:hypothetical protein, partial [Pseudonocardia lacus]|uniref:hypothetical protein n=1 Tax=Pseudonocardia lacus TaxID=2835865 RepID=UPI001BDC6569
AVGLGVVAVAGADAPPAVSPVEEYVTVVVPDLLAGYEHVEDLAQAELGDRAAVRDPARSDRIRDQVLPRLREVLVDAETFQPATAEIGAAHDAVLRALRAKQTALEAYATGLRSGDPRAFALGEDASTEELQAFRQWAAAIAALDP